MLTLRLVDKILAVNPANFKIAFLFSIFTLNCHKNSHCQVVDDDFEVVLKVILKSLVLQRFNPEV